jgi:Ca-activated chloride channel homolog
MLLRSFRLLAILFTGSIILLALFHHDAFLKASPASPKLPAGVSDQTLRVHVDLVNVLCSVFDKNTNSFVTALGRDDFSIYEDGEKQEIRNFARETNLPLTIAMLVDTSGSVGLKLKFEQEAATSFFQNVLKENDRAMLVELDSSVTLLQDFTNDSNKLAKQIKKLKTSGNTALYDAIQMTCDQKLIRELGRKAIIILSDGEDTQSSAGFRQAVDMAVRAESTIFAVSLSKGGNFGTGENTEKGDTTLKEMARETGGKVFFPFKVEELEDAFRQINQELRSQYSIAYESKNQKRDGSYRKIEIKIPDKDLKLNYRKGYFAPSN